MTRNGFTLLEIVLAALLLSTVVAAAYAAFVSANRWIRPPFNIAHNLAREKIERLYEAIRADWWDDISTPPAGYDLDVGTIYTEADTTVDGLTYSREYSVTLPEAYADYRRVEVKVTWPTD